MEEAEAHLRGVGVTEAGVEAKGKEENREGLRVLPFEFVALETCLEAACSCLENEVCIFIFPFSPHYPLIASFHSIPPVFFFF